MNTKNRIQKKSGFVQLIVVVLIVVIILSMMGFDLHKIAASDMVQKNFSYLCDLGSAVWNSYLAMPFRFVWENLRQLLEKLSRAPPLPAPVPPTN